MKLDERTLRLIAVGASITANCQPCLQINVTNALKCGADEQDIVDAIQVGKMVRQGAASKMDKFACGLDYVALSTSAVNGECDCGS
jgi:AhpD family alkylhydroperoxidase